MDDGVESERVHPRLEVDAARRLQPGDAVGDQGDLFQLGDAGGGTGRILAQIDLQVELMTVILIGQCARRRRKDQRAVDVTHMRQLGIAVDL